MTKAIVFDLNGVFIQSPRLSDRYEQEFGVSKEKFLPALKDVMAKVRMPGAGDAFSYWQPYLEEWGLGLTKEEFFKFWFEAEGGNLEMVELAKELKAKGHRLFILSNNFEERAKYYSENFPFLGELFDKIYYSWQTGFVKPDKRAFELLLKENNLEPSECIYFDDSQENIDVASELGIKSFIFEGRDKTKEVVGVELGDEFSEPRKF